MNLFETIIGVLISLAVIATGCYIIGSEIKYFKGLKPGVFSLFGLFCGVVSIFCGITMLCILFTLY